MEVRAQLMERVAEPITVALIGPGVYGSHLAYQIEETPGVVPAVLADLDLEKATGTFREVGVPEADVDVEETRDGIRDALSADRRVATTNGVAAAGAPVDVVVETTGDPEAGARHAWEAIEAGNDVVMVSVEVDATVGPLLARFAAHRGVTYTMAYGDEPAQVVRLADWARLQGFDVVAAGQGTELTFAPHATHEDALKRYDLPDSFIEENEPDARMYNTFLDGTKVAVELAAAANALGFPPDTGGIHMPETDRDGLLETLRPKADGGVLDRTGVIDAVTPSGDNPSAFVVTEAPNEATQIYLDQRYNINTTSDGRYQVFHRPFHLPQETLVSIARAALQDRATGVVTQQTTEVVAAAKRDLEPGETIHGGGGDTVYGQLEDASVAAEADLVPFELLSGAEVTRPIATDQPVSTDDVTLDTDSVLYQLRQLQDSLL
ncbi:SAF domain-containing protein [Halosolutus amylolyticus]|uniref:SAF domain-containing protein n=1 Tax=Halosolutus amylolyticus TaxID=2932267 RepID=A0ABD5PR88_9EURY|nr:SAF domain-containing protein [Halosolutus amylolyticus]